MPRWNDWDNDWRYFAPSTPREAKGGIRAQNQRGSFGESWWAKRSIQVLEGFQIGGRLGRGRSYARRGQVLNIQIEKGHVTAKVQGSRPAPYKVSIAVTKLSDSEWKAVKEALQSQAIFAAKLLAGEMPQDIEKLFQAAGVSLFPARLRDLDTSCSCPDSSNPCKHIAAVYYLLGEEFDRDPFLIFQLRGKTREELMAGTAPIALVLPESPEPLPEDAAAFWSAPALPENLLGTVSSPKLHAALPKRLGGFPFWRGSVTLMEVLTPDYERASVAALELLV